MTQAKTVHVKVRALRQLERHVLWLRANLPKHSITRRAERELLVRRTDLALALGDTVQAAIQQTVQRKRVEISSRK